MNSEANATTVYLVDDDQSIRDAVSSLIRSVGFRVEAYSSAKEFLDGFSSDTAACLVLDVRMPRLSGLDLQQLLKERGIDIPIIFITGHGDIPMAIRAIKNGALEFLQKPFRDDELLAAVDKALSHDTAERENKAEFGKLKIQFSGLTIREKEVFPLIAKGLLNKQIAWQLGVAEVTIKVHRHNIMKKLKVRSLADLVRAFEKLKNDCYQ